jgi:hypothetical protein
MGSLMDFIKAHFLAIGKDLMDCLDISFNIYRARHITILWNRDFMQILNLKNQNSRLVEFLKGDYNI